MFATVVDDLQFDGTVSPVHKTPYSCGPEVSETDAATFDGRRHFLAGHCSLYALLFLDKPCNFASTLKSSFVTLSMGYAAVPKDHSAGNSCVVLSFISCA